MLVGFCESGRMGYNTYMKKIIIAVILLIVLAVGYWLISPLFIVTVSNETVRDLPNQGVGSVVAAFGDFEDGDSSHHATGQASLLRLEDGSYVVRFEDDFEVTNGPDLFVYFGKDGAYDKKALIGGLKASKGGQNYVVPADIDVAQYNEVWVWCRAFGVKFGAARLNLGAEEALWSSFINQ